MPAVPLGALMKKILGGLAAFLLLLAAILVVHASTLRSRQIEARPVTDLQVDARAAAEHLAAALRFRTVSRPDGQPAEPAQMAGLDGYLDQSFPRVHAALSREVVNGYSLLYTWRGTDPALAPVLLLSHLDVVPPETAGGRGWTVPPFSGRIAGGWIWGRGALDDKMGVVGALEAAELLLARGYRPRRTVLLAFGHDEEVGGHRGAAAIAELLRRRGVKPELVLDEGGLIGERLVPGLAAPVALIGTAEKGYLSLELAVRAPGGHSSMPPPHTAIGILAAALARLESHPMRARIAGATAESYAFLGPELPFGPRVFLGNLWLFEPLAVRVLEASPASNATLRTTTAVTIIQAGVKDNVLPPEARAVVNFRILPGDSIAAVEAHVRRTIADRRVQVSRYGTTATEPSAESPTAAPGFQLLARTVREVAPGVVVAPNLLSGATDSRHYATVLGVLPYRFVPMRLGAADLARIHGTDERLGVANFAEIVRFYAQLLRNGAS
jgi:carboxypeptidase PM20D1